MRWCALDGGQWVYWVTCAHGNSTWVGLQNGTAQPRTAKLDWWALNRMNSHTLPAWYVCVWILFFRGCCWFLPGKIESCQLWIEAKMATPDVKSEEKQKLMDGEEKAPAKKSDKKDGTRWARFLGQLCMLAPSTCYAIAVGYTTVCVQLVGIV